MADQLTDGEEVGLGGDKKSLKHVKKKKKRGAAWAELITAVSCALVNFGLNIAGPVKVFELARWSFSEGCEQIEIRLKAYGLHSVQEEKEPTGEKLISAWTDRGRN